MRKIEENIFYRVYIAYLNKDYPATFVSCLYITFIYMFLLAPIYGFCIDLLKGLDKNIIKFLYIIYVVIILILIFKKYYNKVTLQAILNGNRNNKQYLPNWCYFLILPVCMIFGIGLYILITIQVLQRFNLEGYLYSLL
ncbi:hypothetical protein [Chryseobacterium kwangjuense]|uniref:Uncharacterized protein n=1 Tax=Chryseobacterium kwangjuense TaxID=267125 RepID=A0A135W3Q0_9FLAO|nr:hypothetical protein [Chryseobacterium kwangjuense]KXH79543.1 hypothetical protein AU378_19425 [Chryseobacterium kwangjuense]